MKHIHENSDSTYTDDRGHKHSDIYSASQANKTYKINTQVSEETANSLFKLIDEWGLFSTILILPLTILLVIGIGIAFSGEGEGWLIIFASLVPFSVLAIFQAFFKKHSKILLALGAVIGFVAYSIAGK